MEVSTLNLARKWRSQTFDTLVGQEIVVKILKNSLYTSHYFPVYLFAGQRGCGKTSTARIFAAALNCLQLKKFQEKPKETSLPCGACQSCVAMQELRHPDFIEIDAASHTGVDNMRSIIDAAYYLPVLGHKKIYLIDEAHMLSKAAFNALLKVLEEPPVHAHFILATTDPEKIIETVRSRCFTLFFDAIDYTVLANHLEHVCKHERIPYTYDALLYIARCAEGSARDALNILETVRFSHHRIDKEVVLTVLGHVDDQQLAQFLQYVAVGDAQSFLLSWNNTSVHRVAATNIWVGFVRVARAMMWYHYSIRPHDIDIAIVDSLKNIEQSFFEQCLHELYRIEPLFIRTGDPRGILELVLLQLCSRRKKNSGGSSNNNQSAALTSAVLETDCLAEDDDDTEENDDESESDTKNISDDVLLVRFKEQLATLQDQMLVSLLSQIIAIHSDMQAQKTFVQFSSGHSFFADKLQETAVLWHPLIHGIYKAQHSIQISFDGPVLIRSVEEKKTVNVTNPVLVTGPKKVVDNQARQDDKQFVRVAYDYKKSVIQEKKIDISDIQRWPLVNRVLGYFPGTVTVVDEARL